MNVQPAQSFPPTERRDYVDLSMRRLEAAFCDLLKAASPRLLRLSTRHPISRIVPLAARRLIERGVRTVQLWTGDEVSWDAHGDITGNGDKSHREKRCESIGPSPD